MSSSRATRRSATDGARLSRVQIPKNSRHLFQAATVFGCVNRRRIWSQDDLLPASAGSLVQKADHIVRAYCQHVSAALPMPFKDRGRIESVLPAL